eukprot:2249077-Pleurochrysis_carterae.AAC.1
MNVGGGSSPPVYWLYSEAKSLISLRSVASHRGAERGRPCTRRDRRAPSPACWIVQRASDLFRVLSLPLSAPSSCVHARSLWKHANTCRSTHPTRSASPVECARRLGFVLKAALKPASRQR